MQRYGSSGERPQIGCEPKGEGSSDGGTSAAHAQRCDLGGEGEGGDGEGSAGEHGGVAPAYHRQSTLLWGFGVGDAELVVGKASGIMRSRQARRPLVNFAQQRSQLPRHMGSGARRGGPRGRLPAVTTITTNPTPKTTTTTIICSPPQPSASQAMHVSKQRRRTGRRRLAPARHQPTKGRDKETGEPPAKTTSATCGNSTYLPTVQCPDRIVWYPYQPMPRRRQDAGAS